MAELVRVLVVDDSEDDRDLCRRALQRVQDAHYNIDEANDGDKGLARIARSTPDCILLDYSLPGRNGIEVLKLIRASHPFTPVLMLTGQGSETIAVAAMQQGAQNYICKSAIDAEQIHQAIQVAIAHCEMQRRLQEQRLSLEIFTRALAHDLKEPVRTIRSFMTIMAGSETLSSEGRTYFTFVETAAERMSALIEAVYDFTRLDASAQPSAREQIDLNDIVQETIADLTELISETGAHIAATPMPVLSGDRARLRQVLQNLISNAIHHGAGAPQISVDSEDHALHWLISVSDNGPGVDESLRKRVFDPFSRLSKHNGLGMGLAICKRIVEAHRGQIWCDTGENGGAIFRFTIPKDNVSPASSKASQPAQLRHGDSTLDGRRLATILVVDDNEASIELARIMLVEQSKLRCRILSATSGQEAIAMIRDTAVGPSPIDLVLLDINMPLMDGFGVLSELSKLSSPAPPPVVMCSTSSYDKDKERAYALGACGYLEKPPQLRHLEPILQRISGLRMETRADGRALLRVA